MPERYKVTLILERVIAPGNGLEPTSVFSTLVSHLNAQDIQLLMSQTFNQIITDDHERGNKKTALYPMTSIQGIAALEPHVADNQVWLQAYPSDNLMSVVGTIQDATGWGQSAIGSMLKALPRFVSFKLTASKVDQLVADLQDLGCDVSAQPYGHTGIAQP